MDVLSDVLDTVHHTSVIRCRSELTAPWGVGVKAAPDRAYFYVMIRGGGYLEVEGFDRPIPLVGGDVVMLPHGDAHTMRDSLQSPVHQFDELLAEGLRCDEVHRTLRIGGDGAQAALISGEFRFENRGWHPFLAAMPRLIHMRTEGDVTVPWLEATLRFLSAETGSGSPGSAVMVSRLNYDTEQVAQASSEALKTIITDTLLIVFLLAVMFSKSPVVTLTMLVVAPVIAGIVATVGKRYRRLNTRIQENVGQLAHRADACKGRPGQEHQGRQARHPDGDRRRTKPAADAERQFGRGHAGRHRHV